MSDYDRFISGKPVDRVAARVLGRGVHWKPNHKGNQDARKWDVLPTHLLVPIPKTGYRDTFKDLTGHRQGRLTVMGWLGKPNPKVNSRWLCRCACGNYEARSAKAITNPANNRDACEQCQYLERVKAGRGNSPFARGERA